MHMHNSKSRYYFCEPQFLNLSVKLLWSCCELCLCGCKYEPKLFSKYDNYLGISRFFSVRCPARNSTQSGVLLCGHQRCLRYLLKGSTQSLSWGVCFQIPPLVKLLFVCRGSYLELVLTRIQKDIYRYSISNNIDYLFHANKVDGGKLILIIQTQTIAHTTQPVQFNIHHHQIFQRDDSSSIIVS